MAKRRAIRVFIIFMIVGGSLAVIALAAAWLAVGRGPAVPDNATLVLRIGGNLVETPPADVFGQFAGRGETETVRSYVDALRKAKADARISSVLMVPTGLDSPFWGKVQELRDAILDFRTSGKRVVAFLEYGGEREYYLATAADRIFLVPTSSLDLMGIASYELFLRGTLDKIAAYPDFLHVGEYKTAPNQLTERTFTPTHREMSESLNRDLYEQLVRGIAERRKKRVEDVRALIDRGPFLAEAALEAGLVDGLAYEDQLDDLDAMSRDARTVEGQDYGQVGFRSVGLNQGPRIAVIYISGVIASGESGFDPVNGEIAGSATLIETIRTVRADASVRAIVVRIDSPGGSTTASDVIWRELAITRDQQPSRPLVASMSDLAASGGYYVAMAAPQIVAQPATLTGSIGIFGGKIVTGGTYDKLGANIEALSIGQNAEMFSPDRPFSETERAKIQEQLDAFYQQFIGKVAAARKMPVERVDSFARGRVWTGQQAREHGLVDDLGGLDRAIALAKQGAGIEPDADVEIVSYPAPKRLIDLLIEQLNGSGANRGLLGMLGASDRRAIGMLTAPMRLFRRGEPLALMPAGFLR